MRQVALLVAGITLASVTNAKVQPSDIQIEKLGEKSFRLVLKSFRSADVSDGQRELVPTAKQVCSDQSMYFGKYEFEMMEPLASPKPRTLILKQLIHCGDAPVEPAAPSTTQWRPTVEMEKAIELRTYTYFAWKDERNYKQAYPYRAGGSLTFEEWQSEAEKFNLVAGQVCSRKIKKITWYKDPPNGPGPGIYAVVDFAGQFANIDTYCGYVVWYQGPQDGSFRLTREEQNFIPKDLEQKMSRTDVARTRAKFGC